MTRWARANNVHRHKPSEATPWNQLRQGQRAAQSSGSSTNQTCKNDHLRRTQPQGGIVKKPNHKKDYVSEDVNGFMEYLQQSGQMQHKTDKNIQPRELDFAEEVQTAFKKDQRREDRRIKRQNDKKSKMHCFNCRKPGHGLADCPEADRDEEMGRGICYRCGSTEHEIHKCRAKVDPALGEYPFAKCFICGQTGHLSRSCPDNPKGLYAQGGCCRVCGSVEHFQKDCPEHQASTNTMTLKWLSNNMSADHEDVHMPVKKAKSKQTKVVVF
ncbi:unnamed protein product [Knipowitschia caucasica]